MLKSENVTNNKIIQSCRSINLFDFITQNPTELKMWINDGRYLRSKKDQCVIIRDGTYFFNDGSNRSGRNAVNFYCDYRKFRFADAVAYLKKYAKPNGLTDNEIINGYLGKERKIGNEIIAKLIENKQVIVDNESNYYVNIKFCDVDGNEIESVGITNRNFKRRYNSGKYWRFGTQDADKCYVCESAIDAVSLFELCGDQSACYISIGGEFNRKYLILEVKSRYKNVIIAVDNDDEGNRIAKAYSDLPRIIPVKKDWNEDLICVKNKKEHAA